MAYVVIYWWGDKIMDNKQNLNFDNEIEEFKDKLYEISKNEKSLMLGNFFYDISNLKFNNLFNILLVALGILSPFSYVLFLDKRDIVIELGFWQSIFISVIINCVILFFISCIIICSNKSSMKYKRKIKIEIFSKKCEELVCESLIIKEKIKNGQNNGLEGRINLYEKRIEKIKKELTEYINGLEKASKNIQNNSIIQALAWNAAIGAIILIHKAILYIIQYPHISNTFYYNIYFLLASYFFITLKYILQVLYYSYKKNNIKE